MSLLQQPFVRRFAALVFGLAALVSGCGPTGGGTGTGTDSVNTLSDFGAVAASSCSSPFAGSLQCTTISLQPVGADSLAGTAPVSFAGSTPQGQLLLTLQGNAVELSHRCQPMRFIGTWGLLAGSDGRYFGDFYDTSGQGPAAAQMNVQPIEGGLRVKVLSADGRATLLPELTLRALSGPTPEPVSCR